MSPESFFKTEQCSGNTLEFFLDENSLKFRTSTNDGFYLKLSDKL